VLRAVSRILVVRLDFSFILYFDVRTSFAAYTRYPDGGGQQGAQVMQYAFEKFVSNREIDGDLE